MQTMNDSLIKVSFGEINSFALTGVLTERLSKRTYVISSGEYDYEILFPVGKDIIHDLTGCKAYVQGNITNNGKILKLNVEYMIAYEPNGDLKYESRTYSSWSTE